ncbi:MAG: hypothetical protein WA902_21685 [Thermosynechococcaceae cyanobacterium]
MKTIFQFTIERFLTGMDTAGRLSGHLEPEELYAPESATTDGWNISGLSLMAFRGWRRLTYARWAIWIL